MRIMFTVLALVSFSLALMAADSSDTTWKLNVARSKLQCSDIVSQTMKLTATAGSNSHHSVIDKVSKSGEAHHEVFDRPWDGKEHPVPGQAGLTVTDQRIDGSTLKTTFKKDGKVILESTAVVSVDGKVMTRHQVAATCEETLIFEKQ